MKGYTVKFKLSSYIRIWRCFVTDPQISPLAATRVLTALTLVIEARANARGLSRTNPNTFPVPL